MCGSLAPKNGQTACIITYLQHAKAKSWDTQMHISLSFEGGSLSAGRIPHVVPQGLWPLLWVSPSTFPPDNLYSPSFICTWGLACSLTKLYLWTDSIFSSQIFDLGENSAHHDYLNGTSASLLLLLLRNYMFQWTGINSYIDSTNWLI